jgi:hypothetical protein
MKCLVVSLPLATHLNRNFNWKQTMSQLCVHSIDPALIVELSMSGGRGLDLATIITDFATIGWSLARVYFAVSWNVCLVHPHVMMNLIVDTLFQILNVPTAGFSPPLEARLWLAATANASLPI